MLYIIPGYPVSALLAALRPGQTMSWRLSVRWSSVSAARLLITNSPVTHHPLARSNLTVREAKPEITERSSSL
ncbi:MAG TPA: hypothetical protein VFW16_00970, partial [Streptosporangiaceae bacterium]|nr:hypothetical protein [Streptosporangiaceae bacterium]